VYINEFKFVNLKKQILFVVAALLMTTVFAFLIEKDVFGEDEKTFTVGFDAEFPPYGYQDENGEYVGFDLSLAQEVCDRRGWTLVKQPIDWNSKDMELKTKAIDCIWNGFTMNGREDDYTWSTPYVDNSQVAVVKKSSGIKELSDLEGKIVAVQTDSSALAAFEGEDAEEKNIELKNTFAELQQIGDYNTAFLNLDSGAVDCICMDIGVANYQLEQRGADNYIILEERISSEQYGVGFLKGNNELRDQVQETLYEMLDDGSFAQIAEEWGLTDSVCLNHEDKLVYSEAADKDNFFEKLVSITGRLSKGMLASLAIFLLTLLFSLPLGLLVSFVRMSKIGIVNALGKIYISIMRGTPLMLQLLVVFFGPYFLFGINTGTSYRFYAVIIGFSLNYAAYFAEIYRSGIQSVPKGQREACEILGYSKSRAFFTIIFPQAIRNILPSMTNEIITLVKDTSLAFAISYTEMFTLAKQVAASEATIIPLFVAGIFYYVFNFIVSLITDMIEKKMRCY